MTPEDRATFATAMTRLFAIYGDELTDNLLDAWWGVLKPYELREVRYAMNAHATDPDKGRFRPTPADMIRHITETLPAKLAQERRARKAAARDRMQPLEAELLLLEREVALGLKQPGEVAARCNGLRAQIGAMKRDAEINDRPRLTGPAAGGTLDATTAIRELGYADPDDPS